MERSSRRRGRLNERQEAEAKALRNIREGGGLRTEEHEVEEENEVYDEVDEREFENRTAGDRQQARDFIEDDEGIGYLDEDEGEEEADDGGAKGKRGKRQKTGDSGTAQTHKLSSFFKKGQVKKSATAKAATSTVKVNEDDLMDSLLGSGSGISIGKGAALPKPRQGINKTDLFQQQRARAAQKLTARKTGGGGSGSGAVEDDISFAGFDDSMDVDAGGADDSAAAAGLSSPQQQQPPAVTSPDAAANAALQVLGSPPCSPINSPPQQAAKRNARAPMQMYDQAAHSTFANAAPLAVDQSFAAGKTRSFHCPFTVFHCLSPRFYCRL